MYVVYVCVCVCVCVTVKLLNKEHSTFTVERFSISLWENLIVFVVIFVFVFFEGGGGGLSLIF